MVDTVVDTGITGVDLVIAVPAAVLGAAGFGLATAVQQRASKEVAPTPTLSPRLFVDLVRHPVWVLGVLLTVVALAGQLVALAYGPLAVVQPLLVTGVVFAATFAALQAHRRPDRTVVLGGLLCAAGLSAFLLLARPSSAPAGGTQDTMAAIVMAIVVGVLVVACLVYAGLVNHPSRVLALALATGLLFGVTAGLMKVVTDQLREGLTEPFTHPVLYIACVIGPLGFLLSQNTFQQGRLVSPAVAVITSVDPIVAVFAGVAWLGEELDTSPAQLVGEMIAAVAVLTGIAVITLRARHLLIDDERAGIVAAGPPA